MSRIRSAVRRAWRNPNRCASRPLNRASVRRLPGCPRQPSDFALALRAPARVIACHRRLAKLAPQFFDTALVMRERRAAEERLLWMEQWWPALDKAYGPDPERRRREEARLTRPPPELGPRTRRAVEHEVLQFQYWMTLGRMALDRHKRLHPHYLPSLTQLARMADIVITLGRLACGLDGPEPDPSPPETVDGPSWEEALARIYGKKNQPADTGT